MRLLFLRQPPGGLDYYDEYGNKDVEKAGLLQGKEPGRALLHEALSRPWWGLRTNRAKESIDHGKGPWDRGRVHQSQETGELHQSTGRRGIPKKMLYRAQNERHWVLD